MPRRKALPKPAAPVATMTAYVDTQGRTLLAVAALPGREPRVFATEVRAPVRHRGDPPLAPPAEQRAEEWARELFTGELAWNPARVVHPMSGETPLDAAMVAVAGDLAWQREQSEQNRKRRSACA